MDLANLRAAVRFDSGWWRRFAELGCVYSPEWWKRGRTREIPDYYVRLPTCMVRLSDLRQVASP